MFIYLFLIDRVSKRFRLNIEHSVNSTGSAYDVMAILYFQPDVTYVRYSQYLQNIVRIPEPSTEIDKKNVIFKVCRVKSQKNIQLNMYNKIIVFFFK